jgi:hypothetical protein
MTEIVKFALSNIDGIVIAGSVLVYIFIQYRKNGEVTIDDLRSIVEIGVKNAEYQYIKSGGKIDRTELSLEIIAGLFGKEVKALSAGVLADIEDIKLSILNDLPATTDRMKRKG